MAQGKQFVLSRNFRLQNVGDIDWLEKHYTFEKTALNIDELILLNVTRDNKNLNTLVDILPKLMKFCFIPIAVGGGISCLKEGAKLLRAGADKLVLNSILYNNPDEVKQMSNTFGRQCLVGSIDYKNSNGATIPHINCGQTPIDMNLSEYANYVQNLGVGELYINSIDQDGTGMGLDLLNIGSIADSLSIPVIASGGAGNWKHLYDGFQHESLSGVATAHLFNFISDGLKNARENLISKQVPLPIWNVNLYHHLNK